MKYDTIKYDTFKYAAYALGLSYQGLLDGQPTVWDPSLKTRRVWLIETEALMMAATLKLSVSTDQNVENPRVNVLYDNERLASVSDPIGWHTTEGRLDLYRLAILEGSAVLGEIQWWRNH